MSAGCSGRRYWLSFLFAWWSIGDLLAGGFQNWDVYNGINAGRKTRKRRRSGFDMARRLSCGSSTMMGGGWSRFFLITLLLDLM
jgi:hypothetical protein